MSSSKHESFSQIEDDLITLRADLGALRVHLLRLLRSLLKIWGASHARV
jgi:hypothetical protein